MQVWNLLHAACWKQDAKSRQKSPKIAIWAPSHNFVGLYLRNEGTYRQSGKNLLSSNTSSTCPDNMVNFGPLAAEIDLVVWGTPANFNCFASWQRYCTASSSGRQLNFAALMNRGRHLCSAGRPSRWTNIKNPAHILVFRSTPPSPPNNIRGEKCPSVGTSVHKKFLRFQWDLVYR